MIIEILILKYLNKVNVKSMMKQLIKTQTKHFLILMFVSAKSFLSGELVLLANYTLKLRKIKIMNSLLWNEILWRVSFHYIEFHERFFFIKWNFTKDPPFIKYNFVKRPQYLFLTLGRLLKTYFKVIFLLIKKKFH